MLRQLKKMIANAPAIPATAGDTGGKAPPAKRLKQLKSLYDQGLINKDHYDAKVKEIMDSL